MNEQRHEFSAKTKQTLAMRVAHRCSNPACGLITCGPGSEADKTVSVGKAAHITAARENGPRYDPTLTREERRSIHNAIWLCGNCHDLIDGDPPRYPVPLLKMWKQAAELKALAELLGRKSRGDEPPRLAPDPQTIEAILARYCEECVLEWEDACDDDENPDKLTHYVEPHYSLLKRDRLPVEASVRAAQRCAEPGVEPEDPYQPVAAEGDDAETELQKLMAAGPWLCLVEDAGSGKSIFTRRLRAYLSSQRGQAACFGGRPPLVVRWEPRVRHWPERFDQAGLVAALSEAIQSVVDALGAPIEPAEVVRWALREGRVVLILDALDQVSGGGNAPISALKESLHAGPARTCRVVLTSRAFAVTDHELLFRDTGNWRFARVDGFDWTQQQQYLSGLYTGSLEELFPDYDEVQELLKIPVVLAMIRELAESEQLTGFRTRGDLYWQVHEHFLKRAARRLDIRVNPRRLMRWQEILSATAREMMTRGDYNYAVRGPTAVCDVQQGAAARCRVPVSEQEWDEIEQVSHLTDRCILEGATRENLCWKHRGMMEFYCGLHLARNSQDDWGAGQVVAWSNDPEWYWSWRFAIETSPEVWRKRPQTLVASLSALYRPPATGQGPRPGELMYRAWPVLESVPGGRQVLEDFRNEFRDRVRQRDPLALQLVPEDTLVELGLLTGDDAERRSRTQRNFVRCPPERDGIDNQPFWMGTAEDAVEEIKRNGGYVWGKESPRQRVIVSPFWLQTTPVTRGQYGLYDPEHETAQAEWFAKFAPQPDSPVIAVSWYDAWVFAHWIGWQLPDEAQWEYACRAGRDGARDFFHVGDALTSEQANFNGKYPYPKTASKGPYLAKTSTVRSYPENAWGLFDMHGNVWEWCDDWFDNDLYQQLAETHGNEPARNPSGPDAGSSRVLRGGSWLNLARNCRSACRSALDPRYRNSDLGFRLCVSSVGLRPSRPPGF